MKKFLFTAFCLFSVSAYALPYRLEKLEFQNHRVHVVTVNPKDVELHLVNCGGNDFERKNVESIANEYKAPIAINGGFFQTSGAPSGVFYSKQLGKKTKSKIPRGAVGWKNYADKTLSLQFDITSEISEEWSDLDYVLGGTPLLIFNGEIQDYAKEKTAPSFRFFPHARSVIGINKENMLVLIKADAYESYSSGFRMREWAEWLKEFGLVHALNLDGGSSACLFVEGKIFAESKCRVGNALILVEKR